MLLVDCSEKLRTLRKAKGLTQLQVAERIGVTKAMISAYETAAKAPSIEILLHLAGLYGVTVDYLVSVESHATIDCSGLDDDAVALVAALVDKMRTGNRKDQ